ncbi:hypothetical protein [Fervidobacterium sp.]
MLAQLEQPLKRLFVSSNMMTPDIGVMYNLRFCGHGVFSAPWKAA